MKNIVMIYCDELRCDALGCYGNPYGIPTPHIDSLAQNGRRFENCYCTSPVCVPSRYSMLTSLPPTKTGVYHNEAGMADFGLITDDLTFPQVLKEAGYRTATFGKTHIPPTKTPVFEVEDNQGGEMSLGISIREEAAHIMKLPGTFQSVLAADYPKDRPFWPEQVTTNGIAWMKEQKTPFFIRFSFLQPHTPIVVPEKYVRMLNEVPFSDKLTCFQTSEFEKRFRQICDIQDMASTDVVRMRKYYQAMVLWLDEQVGKILEAIQENGILENTWIVFTADHGASRGENGALAKQTFRPESHRIPLIFAGKGIEKGVEESICSNLDLGPTLLSENGIIVPKGFEGVNLLKKRQESVCSIVGYGKRNSRTFPAKRQGMWDEHTGWPQRACIRTRRYRLEITTRLNDRWAKKEEEDLYFTDREKDPREEQNLADRPEYADIIETLRQQLYAYSHAQKII